MLALRDRCIENKALGAGFNRSLFHPAVAVRQALPLMVGKDCRVQSGNKILRVRKKAAAKFLSPPRDCIGGAGSASLGAGCEDVVDSFLLRACACLVIRLVLTRFQIAEHLPALMRGAIGLHLCRALPLERNQ